MPLPEDAPVRRRTVFYVEGYDPRGPAHYYTLYRDEAPKQTKVNGLELKVGPRRKADAISSAWTVSSPATETNYVFLRYDDLMRKRWPKTSLTILHDILRYTWAFLRRGVFLGMYRLSWPIFIFSILSPAMLFLVILLAAVAAILAGIYLHFGLALIVAVALPAAFVLAIPWLDPRMNAFWLARICAFTADQGSSRTADVETRIDAFAERIASEVLNGTSDEVLVVGHSIGSQVGVSACARALRLMGASERRFSFLTLGQTIPLLGLQPGAEAFRAELRMAAADPRLHWIDFSAAADGICFPLTDPVWGSGETQPDPDDPSPKLLSARYPKLFTAATYAAIKRDFYRAHFQYLMAAELADHYDYFLITAGDRTLPSRYADMTSVKNYDRFRTKRR